MKSLRIFGGNQLSGDVIINGAKNSALPIIAASLLCQESRLENIPDISDVNKLLDIMSDAGCKIKFNSGILNINTNELNKNILTSDKVSEFRGSYYLMGALINRFEYIEIAYPGGCNLGERPIDFHLEGFKSLGIEVLENKDSIILKRDFIKGTTFTLPKPSVGATINLILASVFCKGQTILKNVAKEPEVVDLVNYLNSMGANVNWGEQRSIRIVGVEKLNDFVEHSIKPDRIEAGTYALLGAMFGEITLRNADIFDMIKTIEILKNLGCDIRYTNEHIIIKREKLRSIDIITDYYPGFPTDLQQPFTALLTMIGCSTITDNIFTNRFTNCSDLNKMNANIKIDYGCNKIHVPKSELKGARVRALDLRGGMSLILAALIADGETIVDDVEIVERGYPDFIGKLTKLGARLEVI